MKDVRVSLVAGVTEEVAKTLAAEFDMDDLEAWWITTATKDLDATRGKTHEYGGSGGGSADLRVMGDALGELCGLHDAPDEVRQELACWFYALGKVSRLISDYKNGKPGKADSWHDLTVYSMMARRLQETGRWP
ncbi:MAG TPA: hypothetical protein VJW23_01960 [Propionibacteriaceae bacterium]|nr:hypothetical protein [Propionibacteriaceae bacterium]